MMKNPYMSLAVQTIASGIPVVILLRFDVRPHILGRHQLDRVPLRQEQAPKIVCAAARLHRHCARRVLRGKPDYATRPHPPTQHDRAALIERRLAAADLA